MTRLSEQQVDVLRRIGKLTTADRFVLLAMLAGSATAPVADSLGRLEEAAGRRAASERPGRSATHCPVCGWVLTANGYHLGRYVQRIDGDDLTVGEIVGCIDSAFVMVSWDGGDAVREDLGELRPAGTR